MTRNGCSFLSLRGVFIAEILIGSLFWSVLPERLVAQEPAKHAASAPSALPSVAPTIAMAGSPVAAADLTKLRPFKSGISKARATLKRMAPLYLNRLENRPVSFIENRGQFDARVKFQVRVGGKTLWLTNTGIVFDALRADPSTHDASKASHPFSPDMRLNQGLPSPALSGRTEPGSGSPKFQRLVFTEQFVGDAASSPVFLNCPQPGIYNYFIGNDPKKWVKDVHAYSQVIYRNVWKGIDLKLYGKGANVEQEFVVHPGADPSLIHVAYQGIEGLEIAKDGSLVVHTAFGDLRESRPRVYQEIAGKREPVVGLFSLSGASSYRFDVKNRNSRYALVIDPTLLYSTYIGGSFSDSANAIAVDSAGDAYLAGSTGAGSYGSPNNFPTTSGAFQSSNPSPGNNNGIAFITKMNPLGSQLVYSTYLGSDTGGMGYSEGARGIALDSSGDAYVTGAASQGFPTTANAFQTSCGQSTFFAKLNAGGDALVYSTCLGNAFNGYAPYGAVAVDSVGNAYLTGTASSLGSFPTTPNAFQQSLIGGTDVFVAVINPAASATSSLVYSTYLGGPPIPGVNPYDVTTGDNRGTAIAVDGYGMIYVAGSTDSNQFPTTPGAFETSAVGPIVCYYNPIGYTPCTHGFVAKLNPAVSGAASLIYSTYLGATTGAAVSAIAVDSTGSAYVAGATQYDSAPYPTTPGAFQTVGSGFEDAFVTKVNAAGSGLVYSTYVSCRTNAQSNIGGIALDSKGDAFIAGSTRSACFPVTADAFQSVKRADHNAFLTELNPSGSGLIYSTYLGGTGVGSGGDVGDGASSVAVDAVGDAFIAGFTSSPNFPVTTGAFQPVLAAGTHCGNYTCGNAFVTKFPLGAPEPLAITGISPNVGGNAGTITPEIVGTGFHAGATVKLKGGADIVGTGVAVGTEGRTMSATFDLTSAEPSPVDLVVTNPDGTSATLSNAFTIQQGGAPQIRVHKLGFKALWPKQAPGQVIQYFISVYNLGNVDATKGSVSEFLDSEFTLISASPSPVADIATLNANRSILWGVPVLAAASGRWFSYGVTLDPATPLGATVVGGPGCFIQDLAAFSACIANSISAKSSAECLDAVAACGEAGTACAGCVIESAFGDESSECLECFAHYFHCVFELYQCSSDFDIPGCVAQGAHSCDSFSQSVVEAFFDPNYLVGPTGAGIQKWISGLEPLSYGIHFQNDPTAEIPAQQVTVTVPVDPSLDTSTLTLNNLILASHPVPIPPIFMPSVGLNEFNTNLDLRPAQNLLVNVDAKIDPLARTLTWTFTSIDPATGQLPTDPSVGFLAPGADADLLFSIKPKQPAVTGTAISVQGSVVFAGGGVTELPVNTDTWTNVVDNTPPASTVAVLPADESSSCFKVQWSGSDVGSGIQGFTIFVSDDGGAYTAWQTNTTATSAVYSGKPGHEYAFYSEATDVAGNVEAAKTSPEATTTVAATAACGVASPTLSGRIISRSLVGTTLTVVLQLTNTGSAPVQNISIDQFGLRTLSGAGTATYPGLLPLLAGSLAPSASETLTLTINVPSTITKFSLSENGTVQDASGNSYRFSIGQVVYP